MINLVVLWFGEQYQEKENLNSILSPKILSINHEIYINEILEKNLIDFLNKNYNFSKRKKDNFKF